MRRELDEKLCAKYPLIFKNRNADMRTTSMCWGFECGDGWYNILDVLCAYLTNDYNNAKNSYEYTLGNLGKPKWDKTLTTQEEVDLAKTKMDAAEELVPTASQVKEKFGGLRFYTNGATDKHHNYISFAESMSYCTCEECGAPGKRYTDGWHQTLCDIHAAMNGKSDEYESDGEE
jgi:hypothetical protein